MTPHIQINTAFFLFRNSIAAAVNPMMMHSMYGTAFGVMPYATVQPNANEIATVSIKRFAYFLTVYTL